MTLIACSSDDSKPLGGTAASVDGNGSGANGDTGGSQSGDGFTIGDGGSCEKVFLTADRATPDMLIVLDRSGSMVTNTSNTDRWRGSVNAINTVVGELESNIRFGLMTFPGGGSAAPAACANISDTNQCTACSLLRYCEGLGALGCGLAGLDCSGLDHADCDACAQSVAGVATRDQCAPGGLDEPIELQNAGPIAAALSGMFAGGATPTADTLEQARQVLAARTPERNGEFPLPQYVLLVTDGDPNCSGGGGGSSADSLAQQQTIAAIEALASDGARTYVVGFQTANTSFSGVLDQMAQRGGTGDTQHRSVNSGEELLEEFRSIAGGAVTCSVLLGQQVDESRVEVRVDGQLTTYGTDWNIREDGKTIDLLGAACDALQGGAVVEAEVFCMDVRII